METPRSHEEYASYSSFPDIYRMSWIDNESHAAPGTIVESVRFKQGDPDLNSVSIRDPNGHAFDYEV